MLMESKIKGALSIKNCQCVALNDIPVLSYVEFHSRVLTFLEEEDSHCVSYYAFPWNGGLKFICCIAQDSTKEIHILSHELKEKDEKELAALSEKVFAMHIFEREIWENWGVEFVGHPWLKPVRYSFDRHFQGSKVNDYPFYKIKSKQLHEVGVGPIHAGVIEPGHFRFTCNGEMVLHLEIQLGWQHRGVEKLFLEKSNLLQRSVLSESISGDTAIGHSLAFTQLMESLGNIQVSQKLIIERAIALELERVAMHTADIGALCVDTAYLLGANVIGALRTPIINFFQTWCGNRFGKSLIRVGGTHFPLSSGLRQGFRSMLEDYAWRFQEMAKKAYDLPSQQDRFDGIGTISPGQAKLMGSVGMVARMANLKRDIRWSHPFAGFKHFDYEPITCPHGDVFARFLLRRKEIESSLPLMMEMMNHTALEEETRSPKNNTDLALQPSCFSISLTEGWRGEICHTAITDESGNIIHYKVKDPSMHNWKALELSLRDLEISDFPINNKSYNLSYCGHDL
jgi:Ni,Fe-hydrogenase III large subunit